MKSRLKFDEDAQFIVLMVVGVEVLRQEDI